MNKLFSIFLFLLIAISSLEYGCAIQYEAVNNALSTPGGMRFESEVGIPKTKQIMETVTNFIFNVFQQKTPADRKDFSVVRIFIQPTIEGVEGISVGENVSINAAYIEGLQGNVQWEFNSLLYHEMTHTWQWSPPGVPVGLIEGIADYMILKAKYYPPTFAKPGQGDKWDQGYDVTARFIEYCETLKPGFLPQFHKKMRDSYSDQFFVDVLGKPVDQLWSEYKAQYPA